MMKIYCGYQQKTYFESNIKILLYGAGRNSLFFTTLVIIAELAERSPIIIQNNSNPSSQKNFDVRPYKVLLLTCMVNCTMGTPTPRLCSVVQWSVHWAPSQTTQVLVLARARHWDMWEKKMWAPLLGLAKSIYYGYKKNGRKTGWNTGNGNLP